jgi:hypothetical protein
MDRLSFAILHRRFRSLPYAQKMFFLNKSTRINLKYSKSTELKQLNSIKFTFASAHLLLKAICKGFSLFAARATDRLYHSLQTQLQLEAKLGRHLVRTDSEESPV